VSRAEVDIRTIGAYTCMLNTNSAHPLALHVFNRTEGCTQNKDERNFVMGVHLGSFRISLVVISFPGL